MQLPFIGKVDKPATWVVSSLVTGLGVAGITGYWVVVHNASPKINLAELTVPVESKNVTLSITASGTMAPVRSVNISPKTAGRLAELYVEQGDRVQKGQIVARMESNDIYPQLTQAQGNLAQVQARLAELRAGSRSQEIAQSQANLNQTQAQMQQALSRLNLANERVKRNQLLANQGAITRDRLDEVMNESNTAKAQLELTQAAVREAQKRLELLQAGTRPEQIAQAEAQVLEARGRLQAVQVQLDDTLVRAPLTGIITQRYANPGDFVTPTTSASTTVSATTTSIVAIASNVEVLAKVPEVDISQIELGQPVEIVADAYPEKVFQGRVRLIAPVAVVDQDVTSFQVRVALTTGRDKLLSGMNVNLKFLGKRLKSALMVPSVAIVTQEGQPGVLVQERSNQPQFQPVKIGPTIGSQLQILGGLEAGQRVFVELPEDKKLEDFIKKP